VPGDVLQTLTWRVVDPDEVAAAREADHARARAAVGVADCNTRGPAIGADTPRPTYGTASTRTESDACRRTDASANDGRDCPWHAHARCISGPDGRAGVESGCSRGRSPQSAGHVSPDALLVGVRWSGRSEIR
jgi:hypothetical protein